MNEAIVAVVRREHQVLAIRRSAAVPFAAIAGEVALTPDPQEVEQARWVEPTEFRNLGKVFDSDLRFFEHYMSSAC